jgi:SNF2 family DNA or RNA helicase
VDRQAPKELPIASLASEVDVVAAANGLIIRYTGAEQGLDLSYKTSWQKLRKMTREGTFLSQSVEQLVQMELLISECPNLRIEYRDLRELNELSSDFIDGIVPWAPFSIYIQAKGIIGTSSFQPSYQFMLGKLHSFPCRVGPFLSRLDTIYRLSPSNFELVEEIDSFNALLPSEKNKERALLCLSRIKELTGGDGLDDYLNSEGVIIPQKVKVDIVTEEHGFISLFPSFEGVPAESIKKEFFRFSEVQKIYDIQTSSGKRIRILLPNEMIPILKDIQKIRRVSGAARDRVVADVMSCFSDGVDREFIDVVEFAPRVKGICEVPERAQILINAESRRWDGVSEDEEPEGSNGVDSNKPLIISIPTDDGSKEVPLSFKEFREFTRKVAKARVNDSAQVVWNESHIFIDDALISQISELEKRIDRRKSGGLDIIAEAKSCQILSIHQNFESTSYSEGNLESIGELSNRPIIPLSLKDNRIARDGSFEAFSLKRHQEQGILWLQNLFRNRLKRRGCLLADDMGLGKTLQILTFLAWCIESGYKKGLGEDTPPYEPILIVAPIILLNNWQKEMESFFKNDVFSPTVILYGAQIRQYSLDRSQHGRETKDGRQKLDIEKIRENRVVVTNYDTVKNYQHSLAKIPWTVIVADEAQEFKIQNQKSDALKALKAHFRIVATGTPVENRLLDLWNLIDFMHPGSLLGSARDFHERFEKDIGTKSLDEKKVLTRELRNALFYDRPDAFVLRRDKESELTELPKKKEHRIICSMTDQLKQLHFDIVNQFKERQSEQHHFTFIDSLKKLYLHPRLLHGEQPIDDPQAIIAESSKLQKVIEVIEEIRSKREKVLIFAIFTHLQTLLAEVLGAYFGLKIEIISGSTDSQRKGVLERREEAINKFEAKNGFNILILSPKVAGVGLTITGANHVIHYERWWNPAKEAQATDRAYRIGQKKDVHVYYFIASDPQSEIISFDEKLDELLSEKRELAKDFLIPRESDEDFQAALVQGLQGSKFEEPKYTRQDDLTSVRTLLDVDRLSPHQFEALIALIYRRKGLPTILCPNTGDGGADVLVIGPNNLSYVQCKHSTCMNIQSVRAIRDLEEAPDVYRREVLSDNLRRRPPKLIAWTNSRFDQDAKALGAGCGIELVEGKQLEVELRTLKIGLSEIIEFEAERKKNLKEIKAALENT